MHSLVFLVGFLCLAVVLTIAANMHARARRAKIAAALAPLRLLVHITPDERAKNSVFKPVSHLPEFRRGVENVDWCASGLVGDVPVVLFEHICTTGSGKSRRTHYRTVAAAIVQAQWPGISLSTETFIHRIGEWFGRKDMQLDDPEFNRRWRVKTEDENFALLALNPAVQAWLGHPKSERWYIGHGVLARVSSVSLPTKDLAAFLGRTVELLSLLPPELNEWSADA